jgi:hypothetical protein
LILSEIFGVGVAPHLDKTIREIAGDGEVQIALEM